MTGVWRAGPLRVKPATGSPDRAIEQWDDQVIS